MSLIALAMSKRWNASLMLVQPMRELGDTVMDTF